MAKALLKRKAASNAEKSRKKVKASHLSADDLAWKVVETPKEAGLGDDLDGILELEEVDDVEVVYEETAGGKVAKFNIVSKPDARKAKKGDERASGVAGPSTLPDNAVVEEERTAVVDEATFDSEQLLPDWHPYSLHPQLLRSLYAQKFHKPTPIQARAIPSALLGKDVVGVAETGSGKTLAYGLPILHNILVDNTARRAQRQKRTVRALILAPTRELALQVSSHLNATLNDIIAGEVKQEGEEISLPAKKGKGKQSAPAPSKPKAPPLVSVAAIVGGMSAQKQRRILDRGVDVMVATPGRLWDILQEDDNLANQLKNLRFLVLDEADRMIETGHYAELDNILRLTLRVAKDDTGDNPDMSGPEEEDRAAEANVETDNMQTFVFSATLSKDLQRNLKKKQRPNKGRKQTKPASTLDDLVMRLDFRDPEPEVIDLSPEGGMVSTLKESKVDCLMGDKDAYLYYFLLRYPGRSLVFLSSIDGIRRLMPLMELLEINAFPLHSQLEQRQRLKNLDRFKTMPNSVLLATDIAARGLDIPSVDHVVHYQIPRSADVYVHRNGRTARAMREGFSLLMCAPDERRLVRALMGSLNRQEEDIPEMAVELYMLDKLKARIQLARKIDNAQHKVKKENHEKNWLREAAEAMEIEVDSDMGLSSDDDKKPVPSKHQKKNANAKTAALKAELKQLLAQPLVARGISTRYITSGSTRIVDDMIAGQCSSTLTLAAKLRLTPHRTDHETMLGMKKTQAGHDVGESRRKKVKKQPKEEAEEWNGFGDIEVEEP
ncbi:ATP-dependent RNA helicase [Cristinia sonorae]|uniref:RNA helicase n=1 Tax=Cristinia sonorae TaxID=1940300 RepID=A0A8K0US63_9AGAR|nr:ATP-dependent RNA helicase [Cristinia sonorae]